MKNLLKSLLIIAFIAASFQSNAQIKFGVKAGLNVNNIAENYKDAANEDATKMSFGYNVGLAAVYGLSDALSIQSGLSLTVKGYADDLEDGLESGVTVDGYSRTNVMYLEIPVNFTYSINENIQIYAGPYVAFGIGGKYKMDYTKTSNGSDVTYDGSVSLKPKLGQVTADDTYAEDEYPINGLDFGINAGLGYKVNDNILINAGYSLGLGNINAKYEVDDSYGDYKISNRVISVGATYFF